MNEPRIQICLDGNGRAYRPGETLSGEYRLESVPLEEVRAIEVSVLWFTEGKGDEDLAVHHFRRITVDTPAAELPQPGRFSTVLPPSPLSYTGAILKIRWCVRVRVFLGRGKEIVGQRDFQLGVVPPARPVAVAAELPPAEGSPASSGSASATTKSAGRAPAKVIAV